MIRGVAVSAIAAAGIAGLTPTAAQAGNYLGEIISFAGHFCPQGTMDARGSLLATTSNPALFDYYSLRFGGDGRITFAIPDLRHYREDSGQPGWHNNRMRWCVVGYGFPVTKDLLHVSSPGSEVSGYADEIKLFGNFCPGGWRELENGVSLLNGGYEMRNHTFRAHEANFTWCRRDTAEVDTKSNYLGQMHLIDAKACPAGTLPAEDQLLEISSNTALFSILSTAYGGDGRTTFAMPNDMPPLADNLIGWCITVEGTYPSRS